MQTSPSRSPRPRFLLVEDDIITCGFLKAALETLPADVDTADSLRAATACVQQCRYDLWLVDANLPDGHGSELLQRLHPLHPDTPALAHTADRDSRLHVRLREAGFSEVLVKPLGREDLLKVVRRSLGRGAAYRTTPMVSTGLVLNEAQDWDEITALAALNGQRTHLVALRELFLAELPSVRDAVDMAVDRHDEPALRNQLHRLQASCGFVGAARLSRAVRTLHQMPASHQAQAGFRDAVAALLH
ncbi:response regulator [Stenotrophomonas sp. CFBP 13725]|uniref:Hpt domain-containing response regulator n=1 Tax=Stenotrophomonas sp. CFBP 13725 TaxID=2775297 RepID=UPI0017874060|nr:response regulator [Stenotrophomonas sp. CFBP 13725]MBD8636769.1 response regulator [Stenotrophomonas sp. CFBP 13725]